MGENSQALLNASLDKHEKENTMKINSRVDSETSNTSIYFRLGSWRLQLKPNKERRKNLLNKNKYVH